MWTKKGVTVSTLSTAMAYAFGVILGAIVSRVGFRAFLGNKGLPVANGGVKCLPNGVFALPFTCRVLGGVTL